MNKEKCCKITNTSVSLPSAFTREKNTVKRKGIFRPRSIVIEEDLPSSTVLGGNKGYFTQQHNDAKVRFSIERFSAIAIQGRLILEKKNNNSFWYYLTKFGLQNLTRPRLQLCQALGWIKRKIGLQKRLDLDYLTLKSKLLKYE